MRTNEFTELASGINDGMPEDMNVTYRSVVPNDSVVHLKIAFLDNGVFDRIQNRISVFGVNSTQESFNRWVRSFRIQAKDEKALSAPIQLARGNTPCPASGVA